MVVQTATSTSMVNAAFLQEIKDSNQALWHCLHEVRQVCHGEYDRTERAKLLVRLLDDLRAHLALQFALEESYGFIECPDGVDPHLADLASAARNQHCPLYLEISDLSEVAEELQYRGYASRQVEELVERTIEFDRSLQAHERLETDLMTRAQNCRHS